MSGAILLSSSSEPALVSATTDRGTVAELTHLGHDTGAESRHSGAGASKARRTSSSLSSPGVRLQPPKGPDAPSLLPRCEARIILADHPHGVRQRHPTAPDPLRSVIIRILIIAIVALFLVMWVRGSSTSGGDPICPARPRRHGRSSCSSCPSSACSCTPCSARRTRRSAAADSVR